MKKLLLFIPLAAAGAFAQVTPSPATYRGGNSVTITNRVIDTIQDLRTSSSPTFAGLTLTSPLAIAQGGTGQITANAAFNSFAPSQTSNSGKFLTTDGTNTSWATVTSVSAANPTGTISGTVGTFVNGSAATFMRSDAAPTLPATIAGLNSITSAALNTLVLGTGTFGTSVTFASATGIPTFATHVVVEGVTSTGATGTGNFAFSISPTFTGTPVAPTAAGGTNTTQIATTAFVTSALPAAANPTGTIGLSAVNGSATTFPRSDSAPALSQTIVPTWTGLHIFSITGTAGAAATDYGIKITPTYNQTSTAAATDLFVNRTQTAVGSGAQLLEDLQVAGTSKFKVDNTGAVTAAGAGTFSSTVQTGGNLITTGHNIYFDVGSTHIQNVSNGVLEFTNGAESAGVSLDLATDSTLKVRNRANNADAAVTASSLALSSTIGTYNNIATAGNGVPALVAQTLTATKTANFTVQTYTPPATAGTYRIDGVITTTSATNTGTVQFTVDYVDSQGTTHTADVIPLQDAAGAIATTKTGASKEFPMVSRVITINNAATAIVVKAVITGTVSYTAEASIEQVK